jgi:hypothetical protein
MKRILLPIALLVALFATAFAQERSTPATQERFAHERDSILTAYPRGEYLYGHFDAFRKLVDHHILVSLGLYNPMEDKPRSAEQPEGHDTSYVKDVSNNSADQNETSIAINRKTKNLVVAGANDYTMYTSGMPAYYSTDLGKSWKTARVPLISSTEPVGDPVIATDDSGTFYYAYLIGDPSSYTSTICIAASTDGKKWKNLTPIDPIGPITAIDDKEHITVDCSHASPYYGRIYVVWYGLADISSNVGLTINWSDDKGRSWNGDLLLTDCDNFQEVRTGSHGEIYISYTYEGDVGQGMLVSLDGGTTWDSHSVSDFTQYPMVSSIGRTGLKGDNGFRGFAYTTFDVDLRTDLLHMVFGSYLDGTQSAAALYYSTSSDKGSTWANPVPVGVPNSQSSLLYYDRFMPWVSIDQNTGAVYAMYYSSERDPGNLMTSAFRTHLSSAMDDVPQSLEITDFDPTATGTDASGSFPFIGDYNGSDAFDSVYAAAWTRNRTNYSDGDIFVYVSSPLAGSTNAVNASVVRSEGIWLSAIAPNPLHGRSASVRYYIPKQAAGEFTLYDGLGKKIAVLASGVYEEGTNAATFALPELASGNYFIEFQCMGERKTASFLVTE